MKRLFLASLVLVLAFTVSAQAQTLKSMNTEEDWYLPDCFVSYPTMKVSYTYYEGQDGDEVLHGWYSANYKDYTSDDDLSSSSTISVSAYHNHGKINGTFTGKYNIALYLYRVLQEHYVFSATMNFNNGVPEGPVNIVKTENNKNTIIYSFTVGKDGIRTGPYRFYSAEDEYDITGAYDYKGIPTGRWTMFGDVYDVVNGITTNLLYYNYNYYSERNELAYATPASAKDPALRFAWGQLSAEDLMTKYNIAVVSFSAVEQGDFDIAMREIDRNVGFIDEVPSGIPGAVFPFVVCVKINNTQLSALKEAYINSELDYEPEQGFDNSILLKEMAVSFSHRSHNDFYSLTNAIYDELTDEGLPTSIDYIMIPSAWQEEKARREEAVEEEAAAEAEAIPVDPNDPLYAAHAAVIAAVEEYNPIEAEEDPYDDEVIPFQIVEEKPMFNGGDANQFSLWVAQNLVYPEVAKKNSIQGKVLVEFTITYNGEIKDVHVVRSADPALDAEALRVIKASPLWTPGMQRGRRVNVSYIFPVIFQLR